MWTFPVLIDRRPAFLPHGSASVLLSPVGGGTVLSHLRARLRAASAPPVIVAALDRTPDYEAAIREACPDVEAVKSPDEFLEHCRTYELSERLLLADPTCFALDADDPALARFFEDDDPRWTKHLVAFDQGSEGTKEYVDADDSGQVRRIHRYVDTVTWPFAMGVACSLVPVSSVRGDRGVPFDALRRLRHALARQGAPTHDIPLERGALDLSTERGLLLLNESVVRDLVRGTTAGGDPRPPAPVVGPGARVHPAATLRGPIVLQAGAVVEEGATIIGPAVVGREGLVGAGATVAQCVIGRKEIVPPGQILRHRVLLGQAGLEEPAGPAEGFEPVDLADPDGWDAFPDIPAESPPRSLYDFVKRCIDVGAAALGLVLLAPLGAVIAALVKLESRGSVFFAHKREGVAGRPFRCWKFRTMVSGADAQQRRLSRMNQVDGPQFMIQRDPRLTRIGRMLKDTNLDELPQLANVLVGEMSLVGPRPSPFRENQVCIPWREGRLSVRPGITGLWQVCRHDRDKSDFHQWIYYDLLYVQHKSLALDLKILAATVLSHMRKGHVPLSWLLPPHKYYERRSEARASDRAGQRVSERPVSERPVSDRPQVSRDIVFQAAVKGDGNGRAPARESAPVARRLNDPC
jgi:lipopolysaccharide/colanic/teichoic acid biosynthesis glycosyltransferase